MVRPSWMGTTTRPALKESSLYSDVDDKLDMALLQRPISPSIVAYVILKRQGTTRECRGRIAISSCLIAAEDALLCPVTLMEDIGVSFLGVLSFDAGDCGTVLSRPSWFFVVAEAKRCWDWWLKRSNKKSIYQCV